MSNIPLTGVDVVRKAIFVLYSLMALITGCESGEKSVGSAKESPSVSPSAQSPALSSTASPSPVPTASAAERIAFTERETDHTSDQIYTLIQSYQQKLVQAINANRFSYVEPYLAPGSSLYNAQKELVANLSSRNVKERFVSSDIYGYSIDKDHYTVEVEESVEVEFPDQRPKTKGYQWFYTVEKVNGKFLLSRLEAWTTYKQDMDRRSGSVKADGYYAEELLRNYPKILETAINTLDITELKQLSANETVTRKLKDFITGLRGKGSAYSLNAKTVKKDWNTLSFVQELSYEFTDKAGKKQSGAQKLNIQIDEIREGFGGYAVIGYLEDDNGAEPEAGSVTVHRIARIHPAMPELSIKVMGKADGPKKERFYSTEKIEIYQAGGSGPLLQEIQLQQERNTWDGRSLGLVVEDMNFDGYQDIRVQAGIPAGPNTPYLYWLWDQKKQAFVSNTDLEAITAPVLDQESKSIHSHVRINAGSYSEETYQYIDGVPTLVREIHHEADPDNKIWRVTVSKLVNKQLKVTGQYEDPLVD